MTTRVPSSMLAAGGGALRAHPCDAAYGAVGDGVTVDTAAFAVSSLTDAAGVFNALGVTGAATTVDTGAIEGSVANDTLVLSFITGDTGNRAYYTGSYEVK